MNFRIFLVCALLLAPVATLRAQEANSGFDLGVTLSGEGLDSAQLSGPPRNGDPVTAAFRAVVYPTYKFGSHWMLSGAVEVYSHPYFSEVFPVNENGTDVRLIRADLSYSQFWENRSLVIRAGQLSSAFGSFLLRYDDFVNPLVDIPNSYGYYSRGVSTNSLAGAELDAGLPGDL